MPSFKPVLKEHMTTLGTTPMAILAENSAEDAYGANIWKPAHKPGKWEHCGSKVTSRHLMRLVSKCTHCQHNSPHLHKYMMLTQK
jgi:hypothetical protein